MRYAWTTALLWAAGCMPSPGLTLPTVPPPEARAVVAQAEVELRSVEHDAEWEAQLVALLVGHRDAPLSDAHRDRMQEAARIALRADRLDLFEEAIEAVERTATDGGQWSWGSRVLGAQLRLAWAEAELLVALAVIYAVRHIEAEFGRIAADRAIGSERDRRRRRSEEIQDAIERAAYFAACFAATGQARLQAAAIHVERVLAERPDHYLGYRLALDLHRIQAQHGTQTDADWVAFEEVAAELEQRRPDSTGLKFLRGAALAFEQPEEAQRFLAAALDDAPEFTRAQVYRVLAADSLEARNVELARLRAISPHHQLIEWAAPLTEAFGS